MAAAPAVATAPAPAVRATPFVPALSSGDALPVTSLVDQRGRRVVLGGSRRGATVIAFFYTRCPRADACALTSAKFAALARLAKRDPLRLVEITIDPRADTASALARYGSVFAADPERWSLATGSPTDLVALERRLGVSVSRSTSGGEFEHDDGVLLLDPAGRLADTIPGSTWLPGDVYAAAQALEHRPNDPLALVHLALTRGIAAACGGAVGGISLAGALAVFCALLVGCAVAVMRAV